ncbi:hypothetical protein CRUP_033601 [Coryphaenoides rupestris]|nr:hypothetical protein CRUP_033601 [Coryphaenoides rupestris]
MGEMEADQKDPGSKLFENFVQAASCKCTLQAFNVMCTQLGLDPLDHRGFYGHLKDRMTTWKAKALPTLRSSRSSVVLGRGPCGLRTAIELALMGSKVVVIEKRDSFSRNNVLHLWPFTIHDLRGLGAKKFYGKFCAGTIDHISIQQLQLMLLKMALIVGVEFHINVEFVKLLEPPEDQEDEALGWRAGIRPADHPVANFEFDIVVEEISGLAFIFNQKFFLDLKEETGIDLENIVYYKDKTHYFVMTAKKQSLLDKGVVIHLPTLDYAMNHYGQPDVAMFDFTGMHASEHAAMVRERHGRHLLVTLVGDSLLEPFWPMGTGCARGFLAALDTAWMVRGWAQGRPFLELLAERESIYRLLPQTTPGNLAKNFDQYTVDPGSRYPNNNFSCVREQQKQTEGYRNVAVTDLTASWQNGLALCALIHRFKSQLLDFNSLNEEDHAANLQLAFDVGQREFGVAPFASGQELSTAQEVDKTQMILYLSKFYELFRGTPLPAYQGPPTVAIQKAGTGPASAGWCVPRVVQPHSTVVVGLWATNLPSPSPSGGPVTPVESNRVRSMATQLQAMFDGPDTTHALRRQTLESFPLRTTNMAAASGPPKLLTSTQQKKAQTQHAREFHNKSIKEKAHHLRDLFSGDTAPVPKGSVHRTLPQSTDKCHLCAKRIYVVERICTEGLYFHRECFRCGTCSSPLRQGAHVFDSAQEKPWHSSASDGSRRSPSPPGTLTSLLRKGLSWPLSVTRSVCAAPSRLSGWLRHGSWALGAHVRALGAQVRAHGPEYAYLYELLSVGLPLLLVLQEVLLQMYAEAPTAGLSLRPLLLWLEEHVALGFT